MTRSILAEAHIHPAIRDRIANLNRDIVAEVHQALGEHKIVVVGMRQNPVVRKARQALDAQGMAFHYLEYGSYLSEWRRRNSLKMWTGWPTFPMVFVKGVLVGGAAELNTLIASGELVRMMQS